VPQALLDQLACGGRLVAPVGRAMQPQDLVVIEKAAGCVIRAHGRDDKPGKADYQSAYRLATCPTSWLGANVR